MDQSSAQALFNEGGFLLLLDVPEGTEFGIDWNSWTTGPKFKGVKMIPPGVHFIFYSAVSRYDGTPSPRTSFFHHFNSQEILVKRWNKTNEELMDEPKSAEQVEAIRSDLKNLDSSLGAYPYDTLKKWVSMSNHINQGLVEKLSPETKIIHSVLELSTSSRQRDADGLPEMTANPAAVIKFTPVPDKWFPPGSTPAEVSRHSMDSTYVLREIARSHEQPRDVLGELQFAFIAFVLGQVFDAFESWKKLLRVLCSCEEAIDGDVGLFASLIGVLYHQVLEIPQDFFVDIVTSNNFLVATLSTLFSSIDQSCSDEELRRRSKQFRKFLTKKFRWKFNSVPDDWAPVVVET